VKSISANPGTALVLVRSELANGSINLAASDSDGNLLIWQDFEQTEFIQKAHTKQISDLCFIRLGE
jgi:hypothetical protein